MLARALAAVAFLLGACSGTGPATTPSPSVPQASANEVTALPTVTASPAQPPGSTPATWGPLAVRPPEDGSDTAALQGTLRITDSCVYLESAGELVFLTWLADRTTWDDVTRTITFVNFDGVVVTIGDGTHVELGGGEAESDISAEEWINERDWVAPPDSSCELERRWGVGIVHD